MVCTICNQKGEKREFGKYIFCGRCKSIYLENPPTLKILRKENEKYASSVIKSIASIQESLTIPRDRISLLSKNIKRRSTILDVGCGYGLFLDLIRQAKHVPYGMDIARDFIRYLRKRNIKGYTSMTDAPDNYFDAITAFDVIEHISNPHQFIKNIKRKLKKNGYIMISTPNLLGISGRVLKHNWWVFSPNGHFTLFSLNSLCTLLERYGFEVIESRTNSITQWFVPNDTLLKKIANKIIYSIFSPIQLLLFKLNLGDNIEVIGKLRG